MQNIERYITDTIYEKEKGLCEVLKNDSWSVVQKLVDGVRRMFGDTKYHCSVVSI